MNISIRCIQQVVCQRIKMQMNSKHLMQCTIWAFSWHRIVRENYISKDLVLHRSLMMVALLVVVQKSMEHLEMERAVQKVTSVLWSLWMYILQKQVTQIRILNRTQIRKTLMHSRYPIQQRVILMKLETLLILWL